MKVPWNRRTVPGRTRRAWLRDRDADGFATYTYTTTFLDGNGNPRDASTLAPERPVATGALLKFLPPPPGAIGIRVYREHEGWAERRPLRKPWWAHMWSWYRTRYDAVDHPAAMELITEERWEPSPKEEQHGAISEEARDH